MDFLTISTVNSYFRTHEGVQIPLVNAENMLDTWIFFVLSFSNIHKKVQNLN